MPKIGYKHNEESKRKIREARAKQGGNVWNKGTNKSGMKGKKHSLSTIKRMSNAQLGEKNHNWKGGLTPLRVKIWHTYKYRQWRSDVFTRDEHTCQLCGTKSGKGNTVFLQADHYPKAFSEILLEYEIISVEHALVCEELWNINNGRTLCRGCHLKTDNYGGKIRRL